MNKTVLITGASRGIGAETARLFAKNGCNVIINYNQSRKEAEQLLFEISGSGGNARLLKCDVSDSSDVKNSAKQAESMFGDIDVLINNAGIAQQKLFCDITDDDYKRIMGVNLDSVFYVTRAYLPGMIKRKSGRIINIASVWGQTGASCEVHYSAAKAGVIGLTKALAKEVAPCNITVNCIAPGVIKTDMIKGFDNDSLDALINETPLGALGTPLDVANTALFLAGGGASFITGQIISVDGGFAV